MMDGTSAQEFVQLHILAKSSKRLGVSFLDYCESKIIRAK